MSQDAQPPPGAGDTSFVPLAAEARDTAPDFYLSALLAPASARPGLIALAAYLGDVTSIPLRVSEATLARIRLQWWREAIEAAAPGRRSGHATADALSAAMAQHGLPVELLVSPLEACDHLLACGSLAEETELSLYLDGIWGAAFRLAGRTVGVRDGEPLDRLAAEAGLAYGAARLALDLPYHLARGLLPVPLLRLGGTDPRGVALPEAEAALVRATASLAEDARRALVALRPAFRLASRPVRAALLPAALVEPYFKALQRDGRNMVRQPAAISPLRRSWSLYLAYRSGRL